MDWSNVIFILVLELLFYLIWLFGAQIGPHLHMFLGGRIELKAKRLK
jgi:hypothetical protein